MMLTCPMCGGETRVIDSQRRPKTVGGKRPVRIVKRRRECLRCACRTNTFERWENGNPEMIDRDKLEEALRVAKEATNRIMTALKSVASPADANGRKTATEEKLESSPVGQWNGRGQPTGECLIPPGGNTRPNKE